MIKTLQNYLSDFSHLFFPHNCLGCGSDVLDDEQMLCSHCFTELPETGFLSQAGNTVEKIFYGRAPITKAGSAYYFTKNSLLQNIIFELKYRNNKDAGLLLGRLTGYQLQQSNRFNNVDVMVPLPLNFKKEKQRGYNQAALIAKGISEITGVAVNTKAVKRAVFTETQTHKDRVSRWQNMQNVFVVDDAAALAGKHVMLIDDVITTGATLEACTQKILQVPGTTVCIVTVAYTI